MLALTPSSFSHKFLLALSPGSCSVKDARLIGWHHILNVDEGVLAPMHLEKFQGLLNQVAEIITLSLAVVNLVAQVLVPGLKQVHDGQDLSIVWH